MIGIYFLPFYLAFLLSWLYLPRLTVLGLDAIQVIIYLFTYLVLCFGGVFFLLYL